MIKKIIAVTLFSTLPVVLFVLFTFKESSLTSIRSFVILSGSMEPHLPVGSLVITLPSDTYDIGNIVAFTRDGITVTHRIAKKEVSRNIFSFVTKGDANNTTDEQKITQDAIIGKELLFIPYIGRLIVFIKTVPGFLLCIVLPALLFIAYELRDIKREFEKEVEKKILKKMQQVV